MYLYLSTKVPYTFIAVRCKRVPETLSKALKRLCYIGAMEYIGTAFEDYALNEFIKVQLLFDQSFTYVKVSQLKEIPASPAIVNQSKSMFHKSSSLTKNLAEHINEISNFNQIPLDSEFKKNIVRFYSLHKANFKSFTPDVIVSSFQTFLKTQKHFDEKNPLYYIQSVELVDLMLVCKSSSSENSQLIGIRNDLLNCSFLQLPTITDQKFKKAICTSFEIDDNILESKIIELQASLSKEQVVKFFSSGQVLSNFYKESDFENPQYYSSWLLKSQNLESDMKTLFTEPFSSGKSVPGSILPNQLDDVVQLLIAISLNSSAHFFQGLIKCMQLWQINPFDIQFKFIHTAAFVNNSTGKQNNIINPELVEKAFNLSYLAMPFQIQFLEWPLEEKKNFLRLSMKIYDESIESIKPFFGMFFQDQASFTTVLSFLKLLKLNLKNVKQEIKNHLVAVIDKRLQQHRSKCSLSTSGGVKLESLVKYLTSVSRDINLLYNWKFNNKDLNLSFQVFEIGSKILMSPTLELIKNYISDIKSTNFNLITNKDTKVNFGTFIDLVNNLKSKTNFKYDFQNEIYPDFYKVVQSWSTEMINKTKVIIANDTLVRLDGCSYSASVQNLILLFEGYIKLLESFKWSDEYQSSELNILLYRNIINSVKYYHNAMSKKLSKLTKLNDTEDDRNVDSLVCLNNIFNIMEFLEKREKNPNVLKVSQYLIANGSNKKLAKLPNKYISVNIKNAENIEDMRGKPLSLKVRLSGLISAETRAIVKDYNPDWIEEFNVIVPGNTSSANNKGNLRIELIDVDSSSTYKAVDYRVNLNSENLFKNQTEKILLKPKSGSLNISVNAEFEKNDPLFYIIHCKNEIENSIKRSINSLIEKYLVDFKNIFTLPYLTQSLIDNPIRSENNYMKLQDPVIDTLIGNFRVKIIPQIYNNIETKLFDRMIVEFWMKIISIAENLLLPRISIINYRINSKLNRKSANASSTPSSPLVDNGNRHSSSHHSSSHSIHETTREELIRVVEWYYKFRSMLDLPDMILQDDSLNKPFEEFNQIKQLFHLSIKELRANYYQDWNYLNRNMLNKLSKGVKYERSQWGQVSRNKELLLRILLAKGELKFVKTSLEMEQRFEKTVKTEIEVIYLQQFL